MRNKLLNATILSTILIIHNIGYTMDIRDGVLYGGYTDSKEGNIENAVATVNTGDTYNGVVGGYAYYAYGKDGTNEACTNIVTVNGGSISNNNNIGINTKHPLAIAGGYSRMKANNNTVTINEGLITGDIFGGYSTGKKGEAIGNTVNINGGEINGDIYGAYKNSSGYITDNVVNITNGKIEGTVYAGALESTGDFKNNGIIVTGGDLKNTDLAGFDINNVKGVENIYCNINDFTGEIRNINRFTNIKIENSTTTIGEINNLNENGSEIENLQGVLEVSNSNVTADNIDLYYFDENRNPRCGNVNIKDSSFKINDTMAWVDALTISNSTLIAGELGDCWNIDIENSDVDVKKELPGFII